MYYKKKCIILSIFIFIVLLTFFYLYKHNNVNNYEFSTAGALVTKKEIINDNYFILVDHFDINRNIIAVKIKVTSENLWNLIELNKFYTISYENNENNKIYILKQIKPNINFKKIYADEFENYKKENNQ